MIKEAYLKGQLRAFEKVALNALKARQMAAEHGLLPEGSWKWALRNLRKGKSPESLGMAPEALRQEAALHSFNPGSPIKDHEVGTVWGTGATPKFTHDPVNKNTAPMYETHPVHSLGRVDKAVLGLSAAELLRGRGHLANTKVYSDLVNKAFAPVAKFNTLHTHPEDALALVRANDAQIHGQLAGPNLEKLVASVHPTPPQGLLGRLVRKFTDTKDKEELAVSARSALQNQRTSIEHRQKLSDAAVQVHPSGQPTSGHFNPQGGDHALFFRHNTGTHHNIVSPDATGVHTVRPGGNGPDGKGLRSTYYKNRKGS